MDGKGAGGVKGEGDIWGQLRDGSGGEWMFVGPISVNITGVK